MSSRPIHIFIAQGMLTAPPTWTTTSVRKHGHKFRVPPGGIFIASLPPGPQNVHPLPQSSHSPKSLAQEREPACSQPKGWDLPCSFRV